MVFSIYNTKGEGFLFEAMPVSGNEEVGVKPAIRKFSDYPAGIPIKKRWFPMIRPPSPPAEEPSPVESNSLQKDQSSPSQGSTLSYSSLGTCSSSLSDVIKNSEPEERRESSCAASDVVRGNNHVAKVKVEEPSLTVHPGSLENVNSVKEKLPMAKIPINQTIAGKSDLNLVPTESLGLLGMSMHAKKIAQVKVEAEASSSRENTKPLLSLKEPFFPVLSSQNRSDQNQGILEPISLNLSLSKDSSSSSSISQCKSDSVDKLNVENSHLHANRANWDLNTPMDAWEDSSDVALGQTSVDGMDAAGQTKDIKQSVGVSVALEKCTNIERELTNFSMLSRLSSSQFKPDDSLHLRLSPCLRHSVKESSTPTHKFDSAKLISNTSLPRVLVPSSSLHKVNITAVKSEPVEEPTKLDTGGAKPSSVAISDGVPVKNEFDSRSVKSEPAFEGNKETIASKERTSEQLNEKTVQGPDKQSSATTMSKTAEIACPTGNSSLSAEYKLSSPAAVPKTAETACPLGNSSFPTEFNHSSAASTCKTADIACPVVKSSTSTELARNGDLVNSGQLNRSEVHLKACESSSQVAPDTGATLTIAGSEVDMGRAENINTDNAGVCKSKPMNDMPPSSRGNGEGAASDEEKVNFSADMEASDSFDYESDGNQAIDMSIDMEIDSEDDYEDGEVREKLERNAVNEPASEKAQWEHTNNSGVSNEETLIVDPINNADPNSSQAEVKDAIAETAETNKEGGEEALNADRSDTFENGYDKTANLQESSTVQNPGGGALMNEMNEAMPRRTLDQLGKRGAQECQETDAVQATNGDEETVDTIGQGTTMSIYNDDLILNNDTTLAKFANGDDAAKDIDSGSQRSRIINLPRSSGSSSPGRTRTLSGSDRQWFRVGRERPSYVGLEGDKIYSRGRDEFYFDGAQRFSRERHYDQTARNSRMNFQRGRGRTTSRPDTLRGGRESDREFASEFYNSPTEFRVPRHKFASSVSDADFEYNTYNVSQDLAFVGSGRGGGRKPLNDGGHIVRRIPSRRRSPGAARGSHMVRRIPRNISPTRCVGEDGPEFVRLRRNEKFVRFPDDNMDSMFPRPQPPYEGVDGHFAQGNRNFPSVQRRGMQRIRSKSPLGSRTRSPGSWTSPRRRSPEGFAGHPDLTHQRSPQFYRMDRMRSPDRRFTGEVVRRPDMREMDPGRDHGHPPGSVMPNRSPSDRIVLRERRFGGLDPQERPEGDNFFGGPMHPGRLHELGGDVNGDERRFGERRGPVRPYRTNFNSVEGENSHLNPEEGSRPLRFCPDDNAEFRERDFNGRNRPVNAPRRKRNIDEQEANFRHGGQVWQNNNDFDDMARVKRKRF